jgi:hypothetical protein
VKFLALFASIQPSTIMISGFIDGTAEKMEVSFRNRKIFRKSCQSLFLEAIVQVVCNSFFLFLKLKPGAIADNVSLIQAGSEYHQG